MKTIIRPRRFALAMLAALGLAPAGCRPANAPAGDLPPAYTSNRITDPALLEVAEGIKTWGGQRAGTGGKPLYGRVEVLPPVPIVQPYGVGVFQQEVRLPVILTTGPGWAGMTPAEKEVAVAQAFEQFAGALKAVEHEPTLRPTLTIQTPLGMELSWVNHLETNGKYVHGDD